jgi:hypothetical protein
LLEDPQGSHAILETLSDTLLALILAEQAHFQSHVQRLIAEATPVHQAPLGAMFTTLVSGNGLSGHYTRPQKMAFRACLKTFTEQAVALVASTSAPLIRSEAAAPKSSR